MRISSIETNVPDISYISDFIRYQIEGKWYVCYYWEDAQKIGTDLLLYVKTTRQFNECKNGLSQSTNVISKDDKIFDAYEDKIKKVKLKYGAIGVITGIVGTSIVIIVVKAAN